MLHAEPDQLNIKSMSLLNRGTQLNHQKIAQCAYSVVPWCVGALRFFVCCACLCTILGCTCQLVCNLMNEPICQDGPLATSAVALLDTKLLSTVPAQQRTPCHMSHSRCTGAYMLGSIACTDTWHQQVQYPPCQFAMQGRMGNCSHGQTASRYLTEVR